MKRIVALITIFFLSLSSEAQKRIYDIGAVGDSIVVKGDLVYAYPFVAKSDIQLPNIDYVKKILSDTVSALRNSIVNTNLANTDLTLTANRWHTGNGYDMSFITISTIAFTNGGGYSGVSNAFNIAYNGSKAAALRTTNLTTARVFEFPDQAGTIALAENVADSVALLRTLIASGSGSSNSTSGKYTVTDSATTGFVSSLVFEKFYYTKIDSTVTVYGKMSVQTSSAGLVNTYINLPFAKSNAAVLGLMTVDMHESGGTPDNVISYPFMGRDFDGQRLPIAFYASDAVSGNPEFINIQFTYIAAP